jgi:alkyl hydroperoxide reductase subunit AhpC
MLIGQKPLVIYFPKTIHLDVPRKRAVFAIINEDFKDLGAEVIGISSDSRVSSEIY